MRQNFPVLNLHNDEKLFVKIFQVRPGGVFVKEPAGVGDHSGLSPVVSSVSGFSA